MIRKKSLDLFLFLIPALLLFSFPSFSQNDLLNYTGQAKIMVKIDGPATFEEVNFVNGQAVVSIDQYEGEIGWLYATAIDRNMVHYVILEPGEITIEATRDSMIFVSGTPNNNAFYQLDQVIEPIRRKMKQEQYRVKEYLQAGDKGKADSVQQLVFQIADEWWGKQKEFAFQQSNLAGLNYAYKLQTRLTLDEIALLLDQYQHLSDKSIYKKLKARYDAEATTGKGQMAPDFTLINVKGDSVSLSDFHERLILVDFWASWCKPCRVEHPHLRKLYEEWKDHGLAMISVSIDNKKDRDKWLDAVKQDQLTWNQLWDDQGKAREAYGITSVPRTFLIDENGKILAKDLRGEVLRNFVSRNLSR